MGCNCGKKVARPTTAVQSSVPRPAAGASGASVAKTFQSGTMQAAPQAPVRKTV